MVRDYNEQQFLNNRLIEVENELASLNQNFKELYPSGKPVPEGAIARIIRFGIERELITKLLSEKSDKSLETRLLKCIQDKEKDEIEYIKEALSKKNYSNRFWSDEQYIALMQGLLSGWLEFKGNKA